MVRRMHDTYARALELATSGIDLDALVSHRFDLAEAADGFEAAAARAGDKTVIVVSRGQTG
jgi:L-iditol 2-dehydrogenase